MAETLLQYQQPVADRDGVHYQARACGSPLRGGTWQGWIEFIPIDGGSAIRSPRETTQPNRIDTEYWASGLTHVYLEGALHRALAPSDRPAPPGRLPSVFPAPAARPAAAERACDSVLDPFSVFEKGESLFRKQLDALSAWHLVNIVQAHALSDETSATLNHLPPADLIDMIIVGVRERRTRTSRR